MIFQRGMPETARRGQDQLEVEMIPPEMRKQICLDVLAECGITNIREHNDELIHGCQIDPSHRHQESEPTGSLNAQKMQYHCLGCKSSGTILWYMATLLGITTDEARARIEQTSGVFDSESPEAILRLFDSVFKGGDDSEPIPSLSPSILEPWQGIHPYLTDPWGPYGRQIPIENCRKMGLGYAQNYRVQNPPFTSERIIIPHWWKGELVGWQSRKISKSDESPKYLSSPSFPKYDTIYNYDRKQDRVVVVESMLSVVSKIHLCHLEATFGATITNAQISLLGAHDEIILFMDNDDAGWDAVEGKGDHLGMAAKLSERCLVKVVENPWDADVDELTDEDFLALVETAVPFSIWRRPKELREYARST